VLIYAPPYDGAPSATIPVRGECTYAVFDKPNRNLYVADDESNAPTCTPIPPARSSTLCPRVSRRTTSSRESRSIRRLRTKAAARLPRRNAERVRCMVNYAGPASRVRGDRGVAPDVISRLPTDAVAGRLRRF
jgi:hypothetical protein